MESLFVLLIFPDFPEAAKFNKEKLKQTGVYLNRGIIDRN